MNQLRTYWNDLAVRKLIIVLVSGISIILAFVADWVFDASDVRNVLWILAAVVSGTDIAIRAFTALQRKQVTIELLVTIAAVGALLIGEYWESAAVTFLFVFGAWLEARTLNRTRSSLANLLDLAPSTAVVVRNGVAEEIDLFDVEVGDHVLVRPGESITVDGVIVNGAASINEAAITGEPMPVAKSVGDQVFTGTVAHDAALTVEAQAVGAETMLGRIISRVEEAQDAKAPVQTTIEKFAKWYTPAIMVISALLWLITRDTHLALTILVISCPGALVIATPVAFVAGIGRAAGLGILVKGGEFLESISRVTTLALDKTGTLTEGMPSLTDIVPLGTATENDVLAMAAVAESGSTHPLARPVLAEVRARDLEFSHAASHRAVVGQGVQAEHNGVSYAVGTPELMESQGINVPHASIEEMTRLRQQGKTAVLVGVGDRLIGIVAVQDRPRIGIENLVDDLKQVGVKHVALLTGDTSETAEAVASAIGLEEVHSRMLPEDKLAWVDAVQANGEVVAMVGDGINDAPALAKADVSIAMGAAGTDVALETANIALMNDDPMRIVDALRISRKTNAVIRQNLVIAIGTVALLLAGVLMKEVNMAGGMLVHQLSVMVVTLNGMRLMRA